MMVHFLCSHSSLRNAMKSAMISRIKASTSKSRRRKGRNATGGVTAPAAVADQERIPGVISVEVRGASKVFQLAFAADWAEEGFRDFSAAGHDEVGL